MSNSALTWAFAQELPTSAKFVLVVIADKADEADSCYPGYEMIGSATGLSRRAVAYQLRFLEERGLIVTEHRHRDDGSRSSNRYRLVRQSANAAPGTKVQMTTSKVQMTTLQSAPVARELTHSNPQIEPTGGTAVAVKPKRATQRPLSYAPNTAHVALARELGVNLSNEFEQFCDFHDSKGSLFKDWDAALRTWLRNAKKFSGRSSPYGRKLSPGERGVLVAQDIAEEERLKRMEAAWGLPELEEVGS